MNQPVPSLRDGLECGTALRALPTSKIGRDGPTIIEKISMSHWKEGPQQELFTIRTCWGNTANLTLRELQEFFILPPDSKMFG